MEYLYDALVITGMGMISSIGYNVDISCAAARAGITRVNDIETYSVFNEDEWQSENISGHSIPFFTEGFDGKGRLIRLGIPALEELITSSGIVKDDFSKTGFWLSVPDFERTKKRFEDNTDDDSENSDLGKEVSLKLLSLTNINIPSQNCRTFHSGHAGVVEAINQAEQQIKSGELEHCIIGGLDSLLDERTLEWLDETRRLKTSENPAGLIPGEAGAFFLIERYDKAVKRNATILAVINASAITEEKNGLFSGNPSTGISLSNAISSVIGKETDKQPGLIICDHNGEVYRANEWGNASVNLSFTHSETAKSPVWYHAISFGDTCAASGGVAICMAVRGFLGNYTNTDTVLIWASSDNEKRGAICLDKYFI